MPLRIRVAVDDAMAEVSQAADAAENAANWVSRIAERIYKYGVDIDLEVPKSARDKLENIFGGRMFLAWLNALDDIVVHVKPGSPPVKVET